MHNELPDDVVCLDRVPSAQEAHAKQQLLEAEGIHCRVVGDYLDAGFGSLDAILAEVWVRRSDLERAREVLATAAAQPKEALPSEGEP